MNEVTEQQCNTCQEVLPLERFSPNKNLRLGVRKNCKACCSEWSMAWRDRNQERIRDAHLRRVFGITLNEYKKMLAEQNGLCAICGEPPTIVMGQKSRRQGRQTVPMLVVDHDHETGKVRGLLCTPCNRGIGFLKDSAITVRSALQYLEERA